MFSASCLRMLALLVIAPGLLAWTTASDAGSVNGKAPRDATRRVTVDGDVALASLMSLSDGYLQKMADSLHIMATDRAVQTGDWEKIEGPFKEVAKRNVAALNWFAAPDGSYWSVQHGKEPGNLARRAYFPLVLKGKTVIGDLVISTRMGKPVAIVAVPIAGPDGRTVGILGASVYLDKLSALINRQMALDRTMIFFSFDKTYLVALNWDPSLIFLNPTKTGNRELIRAFEEMRSKEHGVANYRFRGSNRTVIFRKSPVTSWWYAFGRIRDGRKTGTPSPDAK